MTLSVVDSHSNSRPPTAVLVVPFKRNRCIGAIPKSTKNFEVFSDCQKIMNQSKTSNAGVVSEWGGRRVPESRSTHPSSAYKNPRWRL